MAKKTQKQAVLDALLNGEIVTASSAYQLTKKQCKCGTMNLHKLLAYIREDGYKIAEEWIVNKELKTKYKEFKLIISKKHGTKK